LQSVDGYRSKYYQINPSDKCYTLHQDFYDFTLKIQGLGRDQIPSDKFKGSGKLLLEFLAAHDFGGLSKLPQQLFESSEKSDQTALVDIGHFAATTLAIFGCSAT
jgi:hypothetical protein